MKVAANYAGSHDDVIAMCCRLRKAHCAAWRGNIDMTPRWVIYQLHRLLGISVGVVLSVMGVTGAIMAFDDEIMTASSPGIVAVPARTGAAELSPDELLARFIEQSPGSIPTKLTVFPEPGKSARLIYRPRSAESLAAEEDNTDGTYLDPYTGAVLGKAVGERFFDTVRTLHRYLLLPHNRGGAGRPITAFAAGCLVFFALSGLYLRWPRGRVLEWRAWLKPDLARRGRSLYWSLHTVAGTWVFLVFLVFAITGPTFGYDGYRDELTALLTWTKLPPAKSVSPRTQKRQADDSGRPCSDGQPADTCQLTAESSRPAPLDTVWDADFRRQSTPTSPPSSFRCRRSPPQQSPSGISPATRLTTAPTTNNMFIHTYFEQEKRVKA